MRRHFETVFGMFEQLHPREAYGGGSGAGLAIVRRFPASPPAEA